MTNEELNDIPYYDLGFDLDVELLKKEVNTIIQTYQTKSYESSYFLAKRKYRKAWSGISLWGSNGELYADFTEGDIRGKNEKTILKDIAPYTFSVIEKIYGESQKSRVRLLRIAPKKSLFWHSHVHEHGQLPTELTIQIPINVPKGFKYCVVNKNEFRWWKRLFKPSWFKTAQCFELTEGRVYYFNSYHYHNVYNPTDEWRDTIMFYVDFNHADIRKLFRKNT